MKCLARFLVILFSLLGLTEAWGGMCRWSAYTPTYGSTDMRSWTVAAPSLFNLRQVPVGNVMASSSELIVHNEYWQMECPWPDYPKLREEAYFKGLELVDGFTNVYKTGIAGVGARFSSLGFFKGVLPLSAESKNSASTYGNIPNKIKIEFIRTSRDVAIGDVRMDLVIHYYLNGWNAAQIKISGVTTLESNSYFSGCAGTDKLNISMGSVLAADVGTLNRSFNLDVLCSGMPAGTKVPVKVYFEGNSDGAGLLNLEPGGAEGVEILLVNDRGVRLPFSQGSALAMTWMRSEAKGEVYRLPVVAEYKQKASRKIRAGKANATLNYILEYN
ncbi:hypothetical protein P3C29_29675 [Pseudomonas sp. 1912-s]|uniref:fimbrial protein n=1 Tax=Pseudomonas sp. 1912-s TaxID=3033802 RepID=UPI0023DE7DBE|nr:hypothetical protein [Pseudomonas sp. 1912-s]MDF3202866.1 hypothetical protein [Pseudomonas sp. 1912-s]